MIEYKFCPNCQSSIPIYDNMANCNKCRINLYVDDALNSRGASYHIAGIHNIYSIHINLHANYTTIVFSDSSTVKLPAIPISSRKEVLNKIISYLKFL